MNDKFYFASYIAPCMKFTQHVNSVLAKHPFEMLKDVNVKYRDEFSLVSFQVITQYEYDLFISLHGKEMVEAKEK